MSQNMGSIILLTLATLLLTSYWPTVFGQDDIKRIDSDVDESSCLCGLNKQILDQLENLIRVSQVVSCAKVPVKGENEPKNNLETESRDPTLNVKPIGSSIVGHQSQALGSAEPVHTGKRPLPNETTDDKEVTNGSRPSDNTEKGASGNEVSKQNEHRPANLQEPSDERGKDAEEKHNGSQGEISKPSEQKKEDPNQILTEYLFKLTSEIHRLEVQIHSLQKGDVSSGGSKGESQVSSLTVQPSETQPQANKVEEASEAPRTSPPKVNSGFLSGVLVSSGQTQNEVSIKLNQSEKFETQELQTAIQSTVPNVVSNIFTNIQNLTQNAEQNEGADEEKGSSLTSIDGNSVNIVGGSSDEVTASGEKLFISWLEKQLQALDLTASVASYIRKSAINLFRRIVKQYVDGVVRLQGHLQSDVRKAVQTALNNTQNLIAFILKHYVNIAGGLMQIIGDQVSRVGKQLDSTGTSIAHISLNPFDIVSNVMESLPNPAEYSKYFRAFGKKLLGEVSSALHMNNTNTSEASSSSQTEASNSGLMKKTMGALSKTFGSWLG